MPAPRWKVCVLGWSLDGRCVSFNGGWTALGDVATIGGLADISKLSL